jgi:hypothetical protein
MELKISANPNRFFKGLGWQMNIFDLSLVALQWLDDPRLKSAVHVAMWPFWMISCATKVFVTASATDDSSSTNFHVMRIVRTEKNMF